MQAARTRRGATRGLLLVGVIVLAAGTAWLAGTARNPEHARPDAAPDGRAPEAETASPHREPALAADAPGDRRTRAGSPASAPAPSVAAPPKYREPAWAACLDAVDPDAVRACLASHLDAHPDPAEIARFLCSDARHAELHLTLVSEALTRIAAPEAMTWIGQLEVGCRRYLEWGLLEAALTIREQRDPEWFLAFRQTLTPERLFATEAGEAGILITTLFLKKGDLEVRSWMESGARGEWGGTAEQIDRAIAVSLRAQTPGDETLAHLRSVIGSSGVPGGGSTGSTFVHALLDARAWPEGHSAGALETLTSLLYDDRFQESAAATVCLTFPVEPPSGCDPAAWAQIRARSLEIANKIGLVMPDAKR